MSIGSYESTTSRIGDVLPAGYLLDGRYTIIDLIARTSLSLVYRARDLRTDEKVVIKYLSPAIAADMPDREQALGMIRREAQILRRLDHPQIPRLYDCAVGTIDAYLALEYIDGISLDRFLDRALPTPRVALLIARRLCVVVEYLHERGILHLDLKPSNVLLTPDGQVALIDFGLARSGAMPLYDDMPMGTYGYAPPEQQLGLPLDQRSDVFALGWVFRDIFARAAASQAVALVLARATAPHPNQRYATVKQFRQALCQATKPPRSRRLSQLRGSLLRWLARAAIICFLLITFALARGEQRYRQLDLETRAPLIPLRSLALSATHPNPTRFRQGP